MPADKRTVEELLTVLMDPTSKYFTLLKDAMHDVYKESNPLNDIRTSNLKPLGLNFEDKATSN